MNDENLKVTLPKVEEYNVLHLGTECTSPVDKKIVADVKRARIRYFFTIIVFAVLSLSFFILSQSFDESVDDLGGDINSLVDEIGTLNQENFLLTEQVSSQEAVLQSIVLEFDEIAAQLDSQESAVEREAFIDQFLNEEESEFVLPTQEVDFTSQAEDGTLDILIGGTNGALMDTIIVASINSEKEQITLFSIPRDLYINGRKINEYYTYYGIEQLNRMVESITGLEMDHYVEVDLNGFVEVVDIIGGIDIEVAESISDASYPNSVGGYDPYYIEAGHHHLDGEEALKYARSRKSTSDFARSERQQEILSAVKVKLLQLDQVLDLKQILELVQVGLLEVATDMDVLEILSFYYDYKGFDLVTSSEHGFVLDSSGEYLYSMINAGGAYILWPTANNYGVIQSAVEELVN
jgi:LCP family protein required for cell wall assembly